MTACGCVMIFMHYYATVRWFSVITCTSLIIILQKTVTKLFKIQFLCDIVIKNAVSHLCYTYTLARLSREPLEKLGSEVVTLKHWPASTVTWLCGPNESPWCPWLQQTSSLTLLTHSDQSVKSGEDNRSLGLVSRRLFLRFTAVFRTQTCTASCLTKSYNPLKNQLP